MSVGVHCVKIVFVLILYLQRVEYWLDFGIVILMAHHLPHS